MPKVVFGQLATMLVNLGQVAANSKDPKTVQQGVCNILAGVANIAAEVIRSGDISGKDSQEIYDQMVKMNLVTEVDVLVRRHLPQILNK